MSYGDAPVSSIRFIYSLNAGRIFPGFSMDGKKGKKKMLCERKKGEKKGKR